MTNVAGNVISKLEHQSLFYQVLHVDQFSENFLLTMILSCTNTPHFHGNQPIFIQLSVQVTIGKVKL